MAEQFHRRGHHVQKAHGRWARLASDGSHLSGAMIALMPTADDAKRLALKGGEAPEDLHVTLFYLGEGDAFDEQTRSMIVDHVREVLTQAGPEGPLRARVFGVAHWNGGEEGSWVWSVGDPKAEPGDEYKSGLRDMQLIALEALAMSELHDLPPQHTPWVPHICAAYTDDLTLVRELEKRLGEVTFDRIRVTFGSDSVDVPLAEALTAAGGLRRAVRPHEADVDFLAIQRAWQTSTDSVTSSMSGIFSKWHDSLATQVADVVDSGDMSRMRRITLDTGDAAALLHAQMIQAAEESAHQVEKEMEAQGLKPPRWTLVGRKTKLMQRTADAMTDIMSGSLIITAKRRALASAGTDQTGAQVAQELREYLAGMSDKGPREAAGAALTAAQNAGRRAVLEAAPPARYYSSEILDTSTCAACRKIDGQEFGSLDKAYASYPTGGYKRCQGMLRCRGMVIARWVDEEPVVAAIFHGSLGDPGYHALHPGKRGKGKDRSPHGGMIGSPDHDAEAHLGAVKTYTDDSHDINEWLRNKELPGGGSQDDVRATMLALNDLIRIQDPLAEDTVIYRGADGLDLEEGDEFYDRGFVSGSSKERKAQTFAKSYKGRGQVLAIKLPKGIQVLQVGSVDPEVDDEKEWVLPPGTKFRITGRTDDAVPGKTLPGYTVEVIPDE